MIFFRALKFLKYLLFSQHKKGHGIHSPYVFNLVSAVLRNKTDARIVCIIENIRKRNISDRRSIQVMDLGSGSLKMKTSFRKVSDIARYSAVPEKYGILLSNLAAEFGKPAIVEFGTSLGISAMYMAAACPETPVYTLEGCPETAGIALENFSASGMRNIKLLTGAFDDLIPDLKKKGITPGLVFIDGNHRKESLLKYFRDMAEVSGEGTVIILDDIHTSNEMEEAWCEIKQHKEVSFTIDIFRMGLVFFREGMNHYDYVIRY
jgi:predicted O-methyltransferase YrrM